MNKYGILIFLSFWIIVGLLASGVFSGPKENHPELQPMMDKVIPVAEDYYNNHNNTLNYKDYFSYKLNHNLTTKDYAESHNISPDYGSSGEHYPTGITIVYDLKTKSYESDHVPSLFQYQNDSKDINKSDITIFMIMDKESFNSSHLYASESGSQQSVSSSGFIDYIVIIKWPELKIIGQTNLTADPYYPDKVSEGTTSAGGADDISKFQNLIEEY